MEYRHILHPLFVPGFTTVFLVGGIGVEDQENGLRVTFLLLEQQIGDTFAAVSRDFSRKMLSLSFSGCTK